MKAVQSELIKLDLELKFCNSKLMGCSGITYDSIRTSNSISTNDKILFWLIKIEEVEKEIIELKQKIIPLNSLVADLSNQEQQVMELLIMNRHRGDFIADRLGVSRNRIYDIKNSIIKKWNTRVKTEV